MRFPGETSSVHLRQFPDVPAAWRDDALAAKWAKVREMRRVVTGALEIERAEKRIGSSLEGHPAIYAPGDIVEACRGIDLADVLITSNATLYEGAPPDGAFVLEDVASIGTLVGHADGGKCPRCFRILPEVAADDGPGAEICGRCADAVEAHESAS